MAQISYQITFKGAGLLSVDQAVTAQVLPVMHQAVQAVAGKTAQNWREAVLKEKLWVEEKQAYAKSITWAMTGEFSATVQADYKYAYEIETGRPQRDLKKMLDTSDKVRRTKDGKRFLVIPLRHNTPTHNALANVMPSAVYDMAKKMAPSKVVSMGQRMSGEITHLSPTSGMQAAAVQTPFLTNIASKQAQMVAKRGYDWGGRLAASQLKASGMGAELVKRYQGMVKMQTSTPGGAKSSSYMTFRIMMDGQAGWIVPAKPGLYTAKKVAEDMQPKAEAAFAAAALAVKKG